MPVSDVRKDDLPHEASKDLEREKDKDREKSSKSKSAAKTKDLSHVPCKFFKAKEICAWFVKGNCKFGHKCALAHVLPGQSMSMDRKNKKAAQAAASAANGNGSSTRDGHRGGKRSNGSGHGGASRNSLLSGSTAPTRSLSSTRPLPMKATLSPSTPAPPVQNTDFASFGLPDESNKLPSAPAQVKVSSALPSDDAAAEVTAEVSGKSENLEHEEDRGESDASPLPPSAPSAPKRIGADDGQDVADLGPIGSPPRASVHMARVNGFSPATSPKTGDGSSPLALPGAQALYAAPDKVGNNFKARSGLSASLGAFMSWGVDSPANSIQRGSNAMYPINDEVVVEDGELEEFIPGSLTDLLTPEERSRRFSRTASTRPVVGAEREFLTGQSPADGPHHRYSRSVPAPSLLQDIRAIWPETPDAGGNGMGINGGGLGNGTPSSFQSNSGFSARIDDILAPSNASAAFLPRLNPYVNGNHALSNIAAGMPSVYARGAGTPASLNTASVFDSLTNGVAMSPPRLNSFAGNSTLDALSSDPFALSNHAAARPIHDGYVADVDDRHTAFSPSTRALQAHAPGQSLPQGLAAGYSRIHALPPPAAIPSPSTSGAFSPGRSSGFSPSNKGIGHAHSGSLDWHSSSPSTGTIPEHSPVAQPTSGTQGVGLGGLESMFSRLSYSAAAARGAAPAAPPGIAPRNVSGRSWHNGQAPGPLSPLSGPALTGEDDGIFSMDG